MYNVNRQVNFKGLFIDDVFLQNKSVSNFQIDAQAQTCYTNLT